jgi:hypothetical protein
MKLFVLALIQLFISTNALALCSQWNDAEQIGVLDHDIINEASGLAISKDFPYRHYHINDSGDGPFIYITDAYGENTKRIEINGFVPQDVEDLAIGLCPHNDDKQCLFVADVGDNDEKRDTVKIVVIEEFESFPSVVEPVKIIELKYPDGSHNNEGIAIHRNGDLYTVTKKFEIKTTTAFPAGVYKLSREQMNIQSRSPILLDRIGSIDFPALLADSEFYGQIITAFDISPSGEQLLFLTYTNALEAELNLSTSRIRPTSEWKEGIDYNIIELPSLMQQEAISYLTDGSGFIFNTEYHEPDAPILEMLCID